MGSEVFESVADEKEFQDWLDELDYQAYLDEMADAFDSENEFNDPFDGQKLRSMS